MLVVVCCDAADAVGVNSVVMICVHFTLGGLVDLICGGCLAVLFFVVVVVLLVGRGYLCWLLLVFRMWVMVFSYCLLGLGLIAGVGLLILVCIDDVVWWCCFGVDWCLLLLCLFSLCLFVVAFVGSVWWVCVGWF